VQAVYEFLPKKSLSLREPVIFRNTSFPEVVRFRTSSSALDLAIILELSAQKQQHRSLSLFL
jgi:hypothetical protein